MSKDIWVVVANGSQAHIYRSDENNSLTRVESMNHPESTLHIGDLVSDKRGTTFDSVGTGRHAMEAHNSPHVVETRIFAKEIVHKLEKAYEEGKFKKFYLTASPAFLGELRSVLPPTLLSHLAGEVNKDLTHYKPDVIRTHLPYVV